MRRPGQKLRVSSRPVIEQSLDVSTWALLDAWTCPIDGGAVLLKPDRRGRAGVDYEWVCHTCGAFGRVEFRAAAEARFLAETDAGDC